MNIYLVGYRGTGKSTLAPLVAAALRTPDEPWQAVDLDARLQTDTGRSIPDIFQSEGEAAFRALEHQTLINVSQERTQVVATGGGIVILPENRLLLRQTGWIVWLQASIKLIYDRISVDEEAGVRRPSLTGKSPLAEIEQVLQRRTPWYQEVADLTLAAEESPARLAAAIVAAYRQRP